MRHEGMIRMDGLLDEWMIGAKTVENSKLKIFLLEFTTLAWHYFKVFRFLVFGTQSSNHPLIQSSKGFS